MRERIDTENKRPVANNAILKSVIKKEELDEFYAQAAALKEFDHPNITRLYSLAQDNEYYYAEGE